MPSQVSLNDLLMIIRDIVDGCIYLEATKRIHGDLAARNCLVAFRDNKVHVVKIGNYQITINDNLEKVIINDYCNQLTLEYHMLFIPTNMYRLKTCSFLADGLLLNLLWDNVTPKKLIFGKLF